MQEKYPAKHLARLDDGRLVTTHTERVNESPFTITVTLTFRSRQNDLYSDLAEDRLQRLILEANDNAFRRLLHRHGAALARLTPDVLAEQVHAELLLLIRVGICYQELEATARLRALDAT